MPVWGKWGRGLLDPATGEEGCRRSGARRQIHRPCERRYCSEMLSLTSKIAASFVQSFNDPVVLSTVNEIETLVTGLSGKIWQKITLLERASRTDETALAARSRG